MKIVAVRIERLRLSMRYAPRTSRGRIASREGMLLALETETGLTGWGETFPLTGFGLETASEAHRTLECIASVLLGQESGNLDTLLDTIEPLTQATAGARAAIDLALHDLAAQHAGVSLATWLAQRDGREARSSLRLAALLAGDEPHAVARSAAKAAARGFRTMKLKVGANAAERDLARVQAVREAVPPPVRLRLDANGAWGQSVADAQLAAFEPFGIEFVEEPLRDADAAGLARLRANSPVPIAVDETLTRNRDAERLLRAGACDVLALKPAALGGLRAAGDIAAHAQSYGVAVAVTSFLDTSFGRSGALHLAASLGGELLDAGLATGSHLASEPIAAPLPSDAEVAVPTRPGHGFAPDARSLGACRIAPAWEVRA